MAKGSCLCRGVQYEVRGPIGEVGHCHCSMCRKAHGAAFGTYARVAAEHFVLVSGPGLIETYESSPGIQRTFCRRCGSTLQFIRSGRSSFALAVATLDEDPGARPQYQIWTSAKVPWLELGEDLLSHETQP